MVTYVINGNTHVFPTDYAPYGYVTKLPALLCDLLAMAASFGANIPFNFDSSTTDEDPGNGDVRINNIAAASATEIYFDNLSAAGVSVAALIDTFDDYGSSTDRGILRLQDSSLASVVNFYKVTGSVVDGTGYRKVTGTWLAGNGEFTNGGGVLASFLQRGEPGADGTSFAVCFAIGGKPRAGEVILGYAFTTDVDFADDFAGSVAVAQVAPTSEAVFNILQDGVEVGTVTFAATETTGTFASSGAVEVLTGESIDIEAPTPRDATLSGIKITLHGTRD